MTKVKWNKSDVLKYKKNLKPKLWQTNWQNSDKTKKINWKNSDKTKRKPLVRTTWHLKTQIMLKLNNSNCVKNLNSDK